MFERGSGEVVLFSYFRKRERKGEGEFQEEENKKGDRYRG